ncbi:chemotaxis protein CheW [Burkholderia perseverans]|uniref:chemotaxis protein CheW n=1 Tax=Burkholderia perseverans TaxID=2615214 RepID=UPI001FEEB940|nr:chemotaxis protein CheW [Burkholderia perseverans]
MHDAAEIGRGPDANRDLVPDLTPGAIDDCWNRIGVRGDQSCERLTEVSRCLNCPVFARNAALLLDRPLSADDLAQAARRVSEPVAPGVGHGGAEAGARQAVLAFRVADEWLALPTAVVRQIVDDLPIHSLPDRRSRAVLGIVNVRGTLRIAVSLAELLGLEAGAPRAAGGARAGFRRMLVVAHRGEPVVFPVDDVEGVLRFGAADRAATPATVARAGSAHTRGVFVWRDRIVGLLDEDRLFESLLRSLR